MPFLTLQSSQNGHYYPLGNMFSSSTGPVSYILEKGKTYWYIGDIGPSGQPNGIGQFRVTINGRNETVFVPDFIPNNGQGEDVSKQQQAGTGWMNLPGLGLAPEWLKNWWLWLIALLALIYILKRK